VIFPAFLPRMLLFDFRGDLEHLEQLKSLPLRPSAIVLGQLLTPTVLASIVVYVASGQSRLISLAACWLFFLGAALLLVNLAARRFRRLNV